MSLTSGIVHIMLVISTPNPEYLIQTERLQVVPGTMDMLGILTFFVVMLCTFTKLYMCFCSHLGD